MPVNFSDPLKGARIWLCGSIPDNASDAQQQGMQIFVSSLAHHIFRDGGSIIHGSHPRIWPVLVEAAKMHQGAGGSRDCLTLAVSRYFSQDPERYNIKLKEWQRHALVQEVPLTPENRHSRDRSLADLRLWMAERCDAVVALGGFSWIDNPQRAGIPAEFELARQRGLPCFLAGGFGGAAAVHAEEFPEVLRNLKNGFTEAQNRELATETDAVQLANLVADQLARLPLVHGESFGGSTFRILSLDGGGICGAFTAAMLAELEKTSCCTITDHFDLIAGTSTGGILATGFGMGMTAAQMLTFYQERGPVVFPLTSLSAKLLVRVRSVFSPRFAQDTLKRELQTAFAQTKNDLELKNARCRLVIPACHARTGGAQVFRTNHHQDLAMYADTSAVEVAVATAAAPTYFRAAEVAGSIYVDGGVWANNPVMAAIVEATAWLRVPINRIDILSVGATSDLYAGQATLNAGLAGWLWKARILGLLMHVQADGANTLAKPLAGGVRLLRLDQSVLPGDLSLDGIQRIPDLIDYGIQVARNPETQAQVRARFLNGVCAPDWERFY